MIHAEIGYLRENGNVDGLAFGTTLPSRGRLGRPGTIKCPDGFPILESLDQFDSVLIRLLHHALVGLGAEEIRELDPQLLPVVLATHQTRQVKECSEKPSTAPFVFLEFASASPVKQISEYESHEEGRDASKNCQRNDAFAVGVEDRGVFGFGGCVCCCVSSRVSGD